jgi:hypothetical protein
MGILACWAVTASSTALKGHAQLRFVQVWSALQVREAMSKLAFISFSAAPLLKEFAHFCLLEHGDCVAVALRAHRRHGCLLS